MEKIESLYGLPKFQRILYYLKSNNIYMVSDLQNFDFQDLIIKCGLSSLLVEEAIDLYKKSINLTSKGTTADDSNDSKTDDVSIYFPESKELCNTNISMTEISNVYSNVPRGFLFIEWCALNHLKYMEQLCEDDFERLNSVKGLGAGSIQKLKEVYKRFFDNDSLENGNSLKFTKALSSNTDIETAFAKLPKGRAFCNYCKSMNISVLADLEDFSFDHKCISGFTAQSMLCLKEAYERMAISYMPLEVSPEEFSNIPCINYGVTLPKALQDEGYCTIGDICKNGISTKLYMQIRIWIKQYEISILNRFINEIDSLGKNHYYCLIQRAKGETLQNIGEGLGITRERVRQIVANVSQKLMIHLEDLAEALLYPNKKFFTFDDLSTLFGNSDYAEIYRLLVVTNEEASDIIYLDFANKFLLGTTDSPDYKRILQEIAYEVIGDGVNFFDNLEEIETALQERTIKALDFEDFMNFLVKNGYTFYGDYVMNGRKSYAIVCADAVRKYFPKGIKLNNDDYNEDLIKLRKIIARYYSGLELPENNRALTSRMVTILIQCGKSRYCHIDSVVYDINVFDDIVEYMQKAPQQSFYYSELFELFKERLLNYTNINTYYFLHGMLKFLFYDSFNFNDRDTVTKQGGARESADDRLIEILRNNGAAMTKAEIKLAFPGIKDFVIAFSTARQDNIISWDYNMYNHILNLDISEADLTQLNILIKNGIKKYHGYISDTLLFDLVKENYFEFLDKNDIANEKNLFYVLDHFFNSEYRFRRPHILSMDVSVEELSSVNVVKYLLDCNEGFHYKDYQDLASDLKWANGTVYAIFSELEKEFIRISEDYYIPKELFVFQEEFINNLKDVFEVKLKEYDYIPMLDFIPLESLPVCQFQWNLFLVESIINEFDIGVKIISPQIKDRRYLRGIVVSSNYPTRTFDELVAYIIKQDEKIAFTEQELYKYLKGKKLIYNVIPQELYNSNEIVYKNEIFSINNKASK